MDGHTDNTGSDAINEKLSQARADAVRDFLASQGLNSANMTSMGRSSSMPVAPNDTADGRKKNRRVEITVSGEVIGEKIG
jgi:adhesin transport system outer membrane protein